MVFKPNAIVVKGEKGPDQPARKVRGRDCLRIIYGPNYVLSENIDRLRKRGLMRKFSLADREFLLGLEGLQRFVERKTARIRRLICVVDPSRCPPPQRRQYRPSIDLGRAARLGHKISQGASDALAEIAQKSCISSKTNGSWLGECPSQRIKSRSRVRLRPLRQLTGSRVFSDHNGRAFPVTSSALRP